MKNLSVLFILVLIEVSFPQSITLRDTTNQYDYIIITIPEFVQVCQTFKQHKETYNGFNVLIVDTGQIYSEFNLDSLPQNNIREFISYAGTYWQNPKLRYVLIVGNVNAVPNFFIDPVTPPGYIQYFQSDYDYKNNLYDSDITQFDFNVGRLPAKNLIELVNYFNKVVWYEINNQLYEWMHSNLFLCETSQEYQFVNRAMLIGQGLPSSLTKKFIEDGYGQQFYGNLDSLMNYLNNIGASVMWFIGYPNDSTFMRDPVFVDLNDLDLLNNFEKYFISIHFSQNAIIDSNTNISRELLFIQDAGSLGAIVVNGIPYYVNYTYIESIWANRLYQQEIRSVCEAIDAPYNPVGYNLYLRKVINFLGDPSLKLKYDPTVNVPEAEDEIPNNYVLHSNYPNPYNNSTKISYEIPIQSNVSIILYDVLGREVATLVNEVKSSGKHQFDFVENNLVSGVYLCTLRVGDFTQTRKMLLLK